MSAVNNKTIAGGVTAFMICCMAFTAPHEGIKHVAYPDTGNIWTICRGHTKGVKKGDVATDAQCQKFYEEDMGEAIAVVNNLTDNAPMPDTTKKVFVDQVFNAGAGLFKGSTMLRKIKAGDLLGACREFNRWVFVGKRDCRIIKHDKTDCYGIVTRRQDQTNECLKGLNQ